MPEKQEHRMNLNLSFVVEIALKSSLILAAAFGLTHLLGRASASLRHLLWISAIIAILTLPVLTRITPVRTTPATVAVIQQVTIAQILPVPTQPAQPETAPSKAIQWIWISGTFLVLGRLAAGIIRTWQIARAATQIQLPQLLAHLTAELKLRRSIHVLEGGSAAMPMTWGIFRSTILVPKNDWPVERLRIVLAHELVHVQRLDYLTQLLSRLACATYWWNPLVWLAAAQLHQERERACDDGVLRLGANAPAYAEHLVELARLLKTARPASAVAVAMATPSYLEKRLVALLDRSRNRQPISRRRAAAAAVTAICLIVPLAALKAGAQAAKGTIADTVYDASRAAVPGAAVTASNLDTKTKETTTTDDAGGYHFRQIPTGRYEMEVKKPGFAPFRRTNLVLTADAPIGLDPSLEIGGVNENVR
jgi:beta-lactamase regulating signal transducer with metallopeptidase domain